MAAGKQKAGGGACNRWRRAALICAAGLWAAACGAEPAAARLMKLDYFELDNGLQVAVAENRKAPVVLQKLYYKTGSVDDPKGKGGVAHLVEHLMFRGTERVPGQGFNRLTEKYGASANAYTTYDETAYYEFADISKLEVMMALEADRMSGLAFDDAAFAAERDIVLQERRQRFETNPAPMFYEMMNRLLWQDNPQANPVSGSPQEIQALTAADVWDFYRRHYRPDNALLVLAGDISKDEARELAQRYFGRLKKSEEPEAKPEFEPGRAADIETVVRLNGVQQSRYSDFIRLEPEALTKKDVLALTMLAEYLTGDDSARLYDALVYRGKKLLSVGADISYDTELGGVWSRYAIPAPEWAAGKSDGEVLTAIKELIGKETEKAVADLDDEALGRIKRQTASEAVYLQENPQAAAGFAGGMLLAGYTPEEIENYDEAVRAVTVGDVRAAWQKVLAAETRVTGYLTGKAKKTNGGVGGGDAD